MKKFYSLLAVVAMTAAVNAQTTVLTEDFSSYTKGGNTSSSGTNAPDGTDVYNPGNATNPLAPSINFPTGSKVYSAGQMAKLGSSSDIGSMTTGDLNLSTDGGNVRVTFDVKGWSTVEGAIVVTVGTTSKEITYTALMAGSAETKWVEFPNIGTAATKVTIATKAKRAYIDNVKIETYIVSLAAIDATKTKANLVKNTIVSNELIFGATAKVSVYNAAGQVVKTAEVIENSKLDVSTLAKGTYIVTGVVNGQTVSQKIIKK